MAQEGIVGGSKGDGSMRSIRVRIFLSCSFDPIDRDVVGFFSGICNGIDIDCVNVNRGSTSTPPDEARKLIANSHALIAIATRRDEVKTGAFMMPKSVEQEISMAYAIGKPILLFVENDVDLSTGFFHNYCTHQKFNRGSLTDSEFVKRAVASIHSLKMEIIDPNELDLAQQGPQNKFLEYSKCAIELIELSGSFTWRRSQTSRSRFTSRYSEGIKAGAWADVKVKGDAPSDVFKWSYNIYKSTKQFCLTPFVEEHTHDCIRISFDIDPEPEKDDFIEWSIIFESPYLNPVYWEDILKPSTQIIINGVNYACYDGHYLWVRTEDLEIQFRFPASLGLMPDDFIPFVRSYTGKIDFIHEDEMKRLLISSEYNAGTVTIGISVKNPLLHHMYGIAWNPPKKQVLASHYNSV